MDPRATPLLTELLKAVSRSFYLTLRVLPARVRPQIGLAYLLARATDTIADTELISVDRRLDALRDLRAAILGERTISTGGFFRDLAAAQPESPGVGTNAERLLLERVPEALSLLNRFSEHDRKRIRDVLVTITSGQELDLTRFGKASQQAIVALANEGELDDYTYRVAGCVGEFWTRLCRAHVFPEARLDDAELLRDGVRFGKGLQLVNILRDLPRDLRHGRCYVPIERLARVKLLPSDLLSPDAITAFRPAYDELIDIAHDHLAAGWHYTNSLPRTAVRVRLACAWPVLIGVRTLAGLRGENPLEPTRRIKIPRSEVKRTIIGTIVRYPFPGRWNQLFNEASEQPHGR